MSGKREPVKVTPRKAVHPSTAEAFHRHVARLKRKKQKARRAGRVSAEHGGDSMMHFRKKPVVVKAEVLTERVEIETLEGTMVGEVGDWLITGVQGEQYPCKPDIFRQTYEQVWWDKDKEEWVAEFQWS